MIEELKNNCGEPITLDKYIISGYSGKPIPLSNEGFHKLGAGCNPGNTGYNHRIGIEPKSLPKTTFKRKSNQ